MKLIILVQTMILLPLRMDKYFYVTSMTRFDNASIILLMLQVKLRQGIRENVKVVYVTRKFVDTAASI